MNIANELDYYKDKEYITNSMLSWLRVGAAFFKKLYDEYPNDDNEDAPYLAFGDQYHCYVLENNKFYERFVVLDTPAPYNVVQKKFCESLVEFNDGEITADKIKKVYMDVYSTKGKSDNLVTKSAMELYEQFRSYIDFLLESTDKSIISSESMSRIKNMRASILEDELAKSLIFDDYMAVGYKSVNELPIIYEFNDVKMKSKIDRLLYNPKTGHVIVIDLKTHSQKDTKSSFLDQLIDSINTYRYQRQAAIYRYAAIKYIEDELNIEISDIESYYVFCQSNIINQTRVIKFSEEKIKEGLDEAYVLTEKYKLHMAFGFDHDDYYYKDKKYIEI